MKNNFEKLKHDNPEFDVQLFDNEDLKIIKNSMKL